MSNWMEKDMAKMKYWFFSFLMLVIKASETTRGRLVSSIMHSCDLKKACYYKKILFENGGLLVLTVSNKPKALWWSLNIFGLYNLSLLWQHFSKLELQNQRHLHARVQSHKLSIWSWELEKAALFIQFTFCRKF